MTKTRNPLSFLSPELLAALHHELDAAYVSIGSDLDDEFGDVTDDDLIAVERMRDHVSIYLRAKVGNETANAMIKAEFVKHFGE